MYGKEKTVCGVGVFGNPQKYGYDRNNYDDVRIYSMWVGTVDRCYNPSSPIYKDYGALGTTISDEWLKFENFYRDIKLMDGFDLLMKYPKEYMISKDALQLDLPLNQRMYCKDKCKIIHYYDNKLLNNTYVNGIPDKIIGVSEVKTMRATNYRTEFVRNKRRYLLANFDNKLSAGIVRNAYAAVYGGYVQDGIPIDPKSVTNALLHRVRSFSKPYQYTQMYHLINEENEERK